jgi:hypothetical protein
MIYNSLDLIPLKLYLKIHASGDVSLLTNKKKHLNQCPGIWSKLKEDYSKLGLNPDTKNIIDISRRLSRMKVRYNFVNSAVDCLMFERYEDFEIKLRNMRYQLRETHYLEDLLKIKNDSESLITKIKRLQKQLPDFEEDPNDKGKDSVPTIDRIIIGYCSVVGVHYDTNEITVIQFDALKQAFNDKIKSLEASASENNIKK